MTLEELAAGLPNGFHDALLHRIEHGYETQQVTLRLSIWVGDLDSVEESDREKYEPCVLVFKGVQFLAIDPPAPNYPFAQAGPVQLDLCAPEGSLQPSSGFVARFFVNQWNSFIQVVAEEAELSRELSEA